MACFFIVDCVYHVGPGVLSELSKYALVSDSLWNLAHPSLPFPILSKMSSKAQPETPSLPQEYGEAAHNVPPLVRLQAWYFSKAGKSIESNRALVKSLSHLELSGWLMQPTHSSSHGKHRRDEFVPVEVSPWDPITRCVVGGC